jgi:hypothetical protein
MSLGPNEYFRYQVVSCCSSGVKGRVDALACLMGKVSSVRTNALGGLTAQAHQSVGTGQSVVTLKVLQPEVVEALEQSTG